MRLNWPHEFPGAYWLDDSEEQAVVDVLRHGSLFRYYGLGPPKYADALEEFAQRYYGARFALALNSGTGGLQAAMTALEIGPGCEVIIPSFLWVATVAAIVQQNAIPVLCEVNDTFTMDPDDLRRRITPRTRLILPIHMVGIPCDMDAIMAIANERGIPVLEDCAQCNGGKYHGRAVGTFGRMGVFSLQLNKNVTSGEGGLVITDDERLYQKAFSSHDMGMVRVNGRLAMPEPDAVAWGAGRRMSELCGAVGWAQMQKLDRIVGAMRGSMGRIKCGLQNVPGLSFGRSNDSVGDCGGFLMLLLETPDQAASVAARLKESGMHNAVYVPNYGLHIYSNIPALVNKSPLSPAGNPWSLAENAQSDYSYSLGACPRSDELFARSVLLPIPSRLMAEQEDEAIRVIADAVTAAEGSRLSGVGKSH